MKPHLAKLILIPGLALSTSLAQALLPPANAPAAPAAQPAQPAVASRAAAGPQTAAAAVKPATGAAAVIHVTRITAAGSVIILADGIVANASVAQIQPPAPGFVYEH